MGYTKENPGPGRPKGSRNHAKIALERAVERLHLNPERNKEWWKLSDREIMERENFHPIIEAVKRYYDPRTSQRSRDFCHNILADRWSPRLKQVEIKGDTRHHLQNVLINIVAPTMPQQAPTITVSGGKQQPAPIELDQPPIQDLSQQEEAPAFLDEQASNETPEKGQR